MLRRAWQNAMIALARSARLTRFVQASRLGAALARRYIAGATSEAALARAARLSGERSIRGSLFSLGEYVSDPATIEATVLEQLSIVAQLAASPLDLHVSVDPTQIGHMLDPALARRNAFTVAEAIAAAPQNAPRVRAMMIDMEDQSFTDPTIALHDELRAAGLPVALTLQAYLRRTEADLGRQIARGAHVRLVKGAFVAGAATSFTRRAEIKANSRRLIDLMFSRERARQRLLSVDRHPRRRVAALRRRARRGERLARRRMGNRNAARRARRSRRFAGGERAAGAALPAVRPRLVALRDPPHRREPRPTRRCSPAR